jgi:hypothetical protein
MPDIPRYDIMLSPQFYVSKREILPIKYPFQAKKLAPSILDELTGKGNFTYEAFKDEESWVFVAYNQQNLSDFLMRKGGSIDQVGHLFFAEQVRNQFAPPVDLNQREVLMNVNDTVTIVPKHLLENTEHLAAFGESFRPDKRFDLKRMHHNNSIVDARLAIALASLLGMLGLAYIAEGYRYQKALGDADAKLEALLNANPSLRGAYARKSIYKKYSALNTKQRKIRDRIKDVAHLTGKDVRINALSVDTKGYRVTLNVPNKAKAVKSLKRKAASGKLKHLKIGAGKLEAWGSFQ